MRSYWWPYAMCAGGIALLSAALQQTCDRGTANFPHAESGTLRYEYCHNLPTGHPWLLAGALPLLVLAGFAIVIGRRERSSWIAVIALLVVLATHVAIVGGLEGNLTT